MIICRTRKWGNSIGLIIPKNEIERFSIREDEEVIVEISKKGNGLKELFGFGKKNKITPEDLLETREMLKGRL